MGIVDMGYNNLAATLCAPWSGVTMAPKRDARLEKDPDLLGVSSTTTVVAVFFDRQRRREIRAKAGDNNFVDIVVAWG
jgi:hypothetical protein